MTPQELDLILSSSSAIDVDPGGFSEAFYNTVFDIAPEARQLFPDDMNDQQAKLAKELQFMIGAAVASTDASHLEAFVRRTQQLGRRHVGYGVTAAMYGPVGVALIATLREAVEEFNDDHEQAWTKLFALVSETMLEGATTPRPRDSTPDPTPIIKI